MLLALLLTRGVTLVGLLMVPDFQVCFLYSCYEHEIIVH